MKTVMIQYELNGEKWEIWQTEQTGLETAWNEIDADFKPPEGGRIYFNDDNDNFMTVNGGFQN